MSKIITSYDPPPIPGWQAFAWRAVREDYDGAPDAGWPANCMGFGSTKQTAIDDLIEREEQ